ncbi:MAG: class I SAM-dependent methyltransferase [Anaerolineae bacterium]|nr:class I SAM-dependent methyltransferase [Anaerolineae bacterium]
MPEKDSRQAHDESAADYDRLARECRCFTPEALFGLCFEYMQPGERLLDIGIGTGLCAALFTKAGLQVSGMDASLEMLNVCRAKDVAVELRQLDVRAMPWPYPDGTFDHLTACGVLHFLDDLAPIFQEAARVVRPGGLFAFTTKVPLAETQLGPDRCSMEIISGVEIFSHRKTYIGQMVTSNGFEMLKDLEIFVGVDRVERREPFCVFVARKMDKQ